MELLSGKAVFEINSEASFKKLALEVFRYQATNNEVYKSYLRALRIEPEQVNTTEAIPFLPIEFFKTHQVITNSKIKIQKSKLFSSSGTTGEHTSKHYVPDISLYEHSFFKCFEMFYGKPEEYCILALLPSYLEREGSSLVYMADKLINASNNKNSGFFLHNLDELAQRLMGKLEKKTLLLGVTYALLDLAEKIKGPLPDGDKLIVMETGGMKGKRKEMVREELHRILCKAFGLQTIHSEYGMTELLSQAYSKGEGIFRCPPWMKVLARDVNDPFSLVSRGATGGLNIIDLANIHSCAFISTADLGKVYADGSFEVLGRFDHSDLRGCNLLLG